MILNGIETQKGFCSWNMNILPSYDIYKFYYSAKGWLFKFFAQLGRWTFFSWKTNLDLQKN